MRQDVPPGWVQENNALSRTIERADFVEALALIVEVGRLAEAANHHPEIRLHRYSHVDLSLTTHSAGNSVTARDFDLAQRINDLSEEAVRLMKNELHRRFQA